TTDIYTLSLHDALPIYPRRRGAPEEHPGAARPSRRSPSAGGDSGPRPFRGGGRETECREVDLHQRAGGGRARHREREARDDPRRSEEHTSELQSRENLV